MGPEMDASLAATDEADVNEELDLEADTSDDDWSDCEEMGTGIASEMMGMWFMAHRADRDSSRCRLQDFPELPSTVNALETDLACVCNLATSDAGVRTTLAKLMTGPVQSFEGNCTQTVVEKSVDTVTGETDKNCESQPSSSSGHLSTDHRPGQFIQRKFSGCKSNPEKKAKEGIYHTKSKTGNAYQMLQAREFGLCRGGGFSQSQMSHVVRGHILPKRPVQLVDEMNSRGYNGQFSSDGSLFVAAYQDRRIRVYDVERNWQLRKDIMARMLRWTITDTALSPDRRFLLYSSITPIVHMVNVGSHVDEVESLANVTDVHDALFFGCWEDDSRFPQSFGIWSVKWSSDGREIIAGTSDNTNVCVFDVETRKTAVVVQGHQDDVSGVAYLDDSSQVFASGSDDTLIKIWDRRLLSPRGGAAGVLVGHTEGVTHLDAKGDGRHLISNSKDQTIKLWDIRKMCSEDELCRQTQPCLPHFHWDYRWSDYPGAGRDIKHPNDCSLMTYRGHSVLQTLIRAYFSPAHSTGQRYIYTGSHSGKIHIFDLVTAEEVELLDFHKSVVRDCSWHPYFMMLASISWDGTIVRWDPSEGSDGTSLEPAIHGDRYDY